MYEDVNKLELELTTHCNAACPQCPRNMYGGRVIDDLPLVSWSIKDFKKSFPVSFLKKLDLIYFCGTYGEPLANKDIVDISEYIKFVSPGCRIGAHTNGGIKTKELYKQLAGCLDFLAFGIDGLADTNHLYRRNVSFKKVMENASEFIKAGGEANWDYIVFRHNQHQVEEAKNLSKSLGFKNFNVKRTVRFFNKAHQIVDKVDVQNEDGEYQYSIYPPTLKDYINVNYESWQDIDINDYINNTCIDCFAKKNKNIYVAADGQVFPCGWLSDRMYGYEAKQTKDYHKIRQMIDEVGVEYTNCLTSDIETVLQGPWLKMIEDSWTNNNRLARCSVHCGEKINMIGEQNKEIRYRKDTTTI